MNIKDIFTYKIYSRLNIWKKNLEEFYFSTASLQRFLSSTISRRQVAQFEKIMGNLDIFES